MQWKDLQKPKKLEFETSTLTPIYGKFFAEPFERGYGTTIGNALRRVLLSSLQGAAFVSVKIAGVLHEFSTIPGVLEETTEIILNIKSIRLKLNCEHPKNLYLKVRGKENESLDITAAALTTDPNLVYDIESKAFYELESGRKVLPGCDNEVQILTPDLHIAFIEGTQSLDLTLEARLGRGYVLAENHDFEEISIGLIPLDAHFSPIRKANFRVENARLGQATDYDKLIIEVWTDGAISPEDALAYSAKILKDQLSIFINFEEEDEDEEDELDSALYRMENLLSRRVDELELSVRSYNCLKNANIRTIADLVQKSESEMLKTKNFGKKSLNEIKEILSKMNLYFGMDISEYLPKKHEKEEFTDTNIDA